MITFFLDKKQQHFFKYRSLYLFRFTTDKYKNNNQ